MSACYRCRTPLVEYAVLCPRCGANQFKFRFTARWIFWVTLVIVGLIASCLYVRERRSPGASAPALHFMYSPLIALLVVQLGS
jgi:RNA polymerase subunit RPABC4/transcription elongation factor Spt4